MFGSKKNITDRVKDSITEYVDEKFDQYRGQIASDLSRGLAALAGLVALWSVVIISGIFLAITVALLIGWLLSFVIDEGGYLVSFGGMTLTIIAGTYYLMRHKKHYIEEPVFKIMSNVLRTSLSNNQAPEKEPTTNKKTSSTKKPSNTPLALPPKTEKTAPTKQPKVKPKEQPREKPKEKATVPKNDTPNPQKPK